MNKLKALIQNRLRSYGYQLQKLPHLYPPALRPIGDLYTFLDSLGKIGFRPKYILDVGANEGHWSETAASIFPKAKFLLIEPQSEMKDRLEAFCAAHPGSRYIAAGAGAQSGKLTFNVYEDFQGSSFLTDHSNQEREKRSIDLVTIDSLYSNTLEIPDIAKLDIQGFELEALKGAESLFQKTEIFILEVSLYPFLDGCPILSDVVTFMSARGYEIYDVSGFARRPSDGALGQMDLVFSRKDGFLRKSTDW